ncbi:MAG: hypothetical protein EBR81_02585 [Proteobacteria bacterium]|nr:hypothetical protein [Pseudomonadota bacterium]
MNWKLPTLASLTAACLFFGGPHASQAAATAPKKPVDPADVEFFEKSVRPLLEEHCVQCHSASKGKTKGGLALDNASAVLKGGDTGPALVPGSPEKSLLIKAVSYTDPELKMPPDDKQMPKADVAILQEWIHRGAYDPREGRASSADPEAAKNHWAFQPLSKPQPPAVRDTQWPRSDTDRFVLAALDAKGIRPSPDAGKRELLRRVSYDFASHRRRTGRLREEHRLRCLPTGRGSPASLAPFRRTLGPVLVGRRALFGHKGIASPNQCRSPISFRLYVSGLRH